ncbi:cytochrome p450 [Holotrichia oblita]|uniref:Cytochrome p450 n=1 Tax=Holotrichia oblita TaxID=644536 RepID=A0ACB9SX71_HOLOL|nr:cytochrome p450 [Holotrichia oblita]
MFSTQLFYGETKLKLSEAMDIRWQDIAILFASSFICLFLYAKWTYKYWERKKVPYIEPAFLIGNLEPPWGIKAGFHKTMANIYNEFKAKGHKYGGIFTSLRPVFVPVDLDVVKLIMIKDFQYFVDRGVYYNEKDDPLSAHLFSIEGDKWRSLRTRLSPTFTSGKMKYMFQMVMDCGKGLENEIEKMRKNKEPIDIKEIGALFTTNVIGSCAFGMECNCFENPDNEFRVNSKKFFHLSLLRSLRFTLIFGFPSLCRKLGMVTIPKDVSTFFMDVIRNIINYRETHDVKRSDFVQLLLNIKNGAAADGNSFTFNEIAAQAFVFFIAGFETSSSTMTFAFYEMAKNQEVQDKVREEIRKVVAKYDGKITYDGIMEMTYMSQVFDEALRKYPIVATLQRITTKDYKLPGEDVVLKKGSKVMISLQGIHHDPEIYPNPEKFDPDRFTPENKEQRHACAYMPFGEGPRICIGMRFGIMQAKIGMAIMLKDYKYTLHPDSRDMKLHNKSILLAPVGKVLLNIEKGRMEIRSQDIAILLGTVTLCLYLYIKWVYNYWGRRNVPYQTPTFPFGNIEPLWAMKNGFHHTIAGIYKDFKEKGHKFGGAFTLLRPAFIPVDLDILKHIMIKDFQYFVDRGVYYNEEADPLSAHLFSIEGDKWRSLRARLSPTFTSGKMKNMFEMVMDCGQGLEDEVAKLCKNKQAVNIKEMGALFTTNVIGSCAFGLECNCFENPNNEFRHHTRRFFEGGVARVARTLLTLTFPSLCKKLGVIVFAEDTTKFYSNVVKNIVDYREANNVKRNDFVQLLLNMKNGESSEKGSFTFNEIAAQAFVFFLAGFETSSSTMTFAFYEMAKNQEVQDKVREEIRRVLAKYNGKITYDGIMEMTYMSQVFDEALRKYPIVATLERIATKDYKIPGKDLVLKKGTKVMISLQGIHHDPEYYPNPEKFDPDRFTPVNKEKRHVCAYMPFGEGPRICIGLRFGIMQAKIGMAIMLKDYKYTLHPNNPDMKLSSKAPLLAPTGDVLLNIEKVD